MGYLDFLDKIFGDDEEEELPEGYSTDPESGAVRVVIQRPDDEGPNLEVLPEDEEGPVFDSPFMIPATSAYDTFIEGTVLGTGGDDVLLPLSPLTNFLNQEIEPEEPMTPPELETFREQRAAYQGPRTIPDADSGAYPEIPLFRQVADHTAMFAAHIPRLDPEKSRLIAELQMVGEQASYLGREGDPGIMLRQGAAGLDPRSPNLLEDEFDAMPRTAPRISEPLIQDLRDAAQGLDATTPEGQRELRRRLEAEGLLTPYTPRDPLFGAVGATQTEGRSIRDALDYMSRNPDDSAVLQAFFIDRGLDMGDLQTDEGRNSLTDEITYRLNTDPDPAFQGAVTTMYQFYRRNFAPQADLDIVSPGARGRIADYIIRVQAPAEDERADYRGRVIGHLEEFYPNIPE